MVIDNLVEESWVKFLETYLILVPFKLIPLYTFNSVINRAFRFSEELEDYEALKRAVETNTKNPLRHYELHFQKIKRINKGFWSGYADYQILLSLPTERVRSGEVFPLTKYFPKAHG